MADTKRLAYVEIAGEPQIACLVPGDLAINEGDECVLDDNRVLEFGRVTGIETVQGELRREKGMPTVLRRATLQDKAQYGETVVRSKMALATTRGKVAEHKLSMRLMRVRYSLDRALLRVVFAAEERVDFRELVRDLAEELHARIEMRQVGVRDEAGIIGGIGSCGRVLCCASWLHDFESVNVKMAKVQQLSLNPGTISGVCGRLKCCLRYEHECYRDLGSRLPREGTAVRLPQGSGMVTGRDILRQRLQVRLEDGRTVHVPAAEAEYAAEPAGRENGGRAGGGEEEGDE